MRSQEKKRLMKLLSLLFNLFHVARK